jgi:hypothetical protein
VLRLAHLRSIIAAGAVGCLLLTAGALGTARAGGLASGHAWIRVDQLGYLPDETKTAYLLAPAAAPDAAFAVVDGGGNAVLRGHAGASGGRWNARFRAVEPLDFTELDVPGTYRIRAAGSTSPPFRIAPASELLRPRVADAVAFFQAQRDGQDVIPGPLDRRPSHLNDADATVYAWPRYENADSDVIVGDGLRPLGWTVDLEGGWFDAGDFIKFTHTTAYATALMLIAQRELGSDAPPSLAGETQFGLHWLAKAWDDRRRVLALQVGIGSGNTAGTFAGDHDVWRLPERDDGLTGPDNRYLRNRPAFVANLPGDPLPPNLAGRVSAAFALAAQVDAQERPARARTELALAAEIFDAAKTAGVGPADVVTALPHAFYPESSWRDDLELGAAELALAGQALGDPHAGEWLRSAARWAERYLATNAGSETLNLYDTSAVAHAELVRALRASDRRERTAVGENSLLADLRSQLQIGVARAAGDPFGAGVVYDDFDAASHAFGLVATAELYRLLTGDDRYDGFVTAQRDWALGANPWGASLMIGVGTDFPRCPQHVVANLSGGRNGSWPYLLGAVVNGPNDARLFAGGLGEFFDEGRLCPDPPGDRYAPFTAHGSRYIDDVRSWQTVEPAIDFTATALLAFALA